MADHPAKPDPREGRPIDDNIDDLGRRPDGTKLEQPGSAETPKNQPTGKDDGDEPPARS
jgi:hypothetical protein